MNIETSGEANKFNVSSEICPKCGAIVVVENGKPEKCDRCNVIPGWLKAQK